MILLVLVLTVLCGCRGEEPAKRGVPAPNQASAVPRQAGCAGCHPQARPAAPHAFSCPDCHRGNAEADLKETAHQGLVARPAHPDRMAEICGKCHAGVVRECAASLHFTLRNEVNLVRSHFGASAPLHDLTGIPVVQDPTTPLELADDMLRRRCLRCHVYAPGDDYPLTRHGTGCAACHMEFSEGRLQSHRLLAKPGDQQCLACHYGNITGADYHGRFEQDYNREYRTPYVTHAPFIRPYGVEDYALVPDIHQQRGLACIDCHRGHGFKAAGQVQITCATCHRPAQERGGELPDNVARERNTLVLTSALDGKKHVIPPMRDPAHDQYGQQVACPVCHAQWSFNDSTTYLLRSESDDFQPWERLAVQGSSEVEQRLSENLAAGGQASAPAMRDGITGGERPGIWYQGFTQRRWDDLPIRRDEDGIIKVFRPVLDLRLSSVAGDGRVILDNVAGNGPALRPYVPHTIGPAGMFYKNRFAALLAQAAPAKDR